MLLRLLLREDRLVLLVSLLLLRPRAGRRGGEERPPLGGDAPLRGGDLGRLRGEGERRLTGDAPPLRGGLRLRGDRDGERLRWAGTPLTGLRERLLIGEPPPLRGGDCGLRSPALRGGDPPLGGGGSLRGGERLPTSLLLLLPGLSLSLSRPKSCRSLSRIPPRRSLPKSLPRGPLSRPLSLPLTGLGPLRSRSSRRGGEGSRGGGGSLGGGGGGGLSSFFRNWKATLMIFPSNWPPFKKSIALTASECRSYSTTAVPFGRFTVLSMFTSATMIGPYVLKISFKWSSLTLRVRLLTIRRVAPFSSLSLIASALFLVSASSISMSPFSATRPLGDFDFRCGEPLLPLLLELDPDDEDDDEPEGDPDLDLEPDEPDEREASSLDFAMAAADEFLSNPAQPVYVCDEV